MFASPFNDNNSVKRHWILTLNNKVKIELENKNSNDKDISPFLHKEIYILIMNVVQIFLKVLVILFNGKIEHRKN